MTTIQKVTIILNTHADWEVWIDMIRNRAKVANVWQFMDPATRKENLPALTRPTLPMPRDVNPRKTLISELTAEEAEELKILRDDQKSRNREYKRQQSSIESLHTLIHKTVSRVYYIYLVENDTLHDMLIALKQRIAPSDQVRELELTNRYLKLKKTPKDQNIDDWLKQWETTYASCKKLNLPDVAKTRPLYDFLKAVQELTPDFAGVWMVRIQERERNGEAIPDIYTILEYFQNHIRVQNAQKTQVEHGAFAPTFRNQKLEDKNKVQGMLVPEGGSTAGELEARFDDTEAD